MAKKIADLQKESQEMAEAAKSGMPKINAIRNAILEAGNIPDATERRDALFAETTDLEYVYSDLIVLQLKHIEKLYAHHQAEVSGCCCVGWSRPPQA